MYGYLIRDDWKEGCQPLINRMPFPFTQPYHVGKCFSMSTAAGPKRRGMFAWTSNYVLR